MCEICKRYSEDQPRDPDGKFASGGGDDEGGLFHYTNEENVAGIEKDGIRVSDGTFGRGVYLSTDPKGVASRVYATHRVEVNLAPGLTTKVLDTKNGSASRQVDEWSGDEDP